MPTYLFDEIVGSSSKKIAYVYEERRTRAALRIEYLIRRPKSKLPLMTPVLIFAGYLGRKLTTANAANADDVIATGSQLSLAWGRVAEFLSMATNQGYEKVGSDLSRDTNQEQLTALKRSSGLLEVIDSGAISAAEVTDVIHNAGVWAVGPSDSQRRACDSALQLKDALESIAIAAQNALGHSIAYARIACVCTRLLEAVAMEWETPGSSPGAAEAAEVVKLAARVPTIRRTAGIFCEAFRAAEIDIRTAMHEWTKDRWVGDALVGSLADQLVLSDDHVKSMSVPIRGFAPFTIDKDVLDGDLFGEWLATQPQLPKVTEEMLSRTGSNPLWAQTKRIGIDTATAAVWLERLTRLITSTDGLDSLVLKVTGSQEASLGGLRPPPVDMTGLALASEIYSYDALAVDTAPLTDNAADGYGVAWPGSEDALIALGLNAASNQTVEGVRDAIAGKAIKYLPVYGQTSVPRPTKKTLHTSFVQLMPVIEQFDKHTLASPPSFESLLQLWRRDIDNWRRDLSVFAAQATALPSQGMEVEGTLALRYLAELLRLVGVLCIQNGARVNYPVTPLSRHYYRTTGMGVDEILGEAITLGTIPGTRDSLVLRPFKQVPASASVELLPVSRRLIDPANEKDSRPIFQWLTNTPVVAGSGLEIRGWRVGSSLEDGLSAELYLLQLERDADDRDDVILSSSVSNEDELALITKANRVWAYSGEAKPARKLPAVSLPAPRLW